MAVLFIHSAVMEQSDSADIDCWCKPSGTLFRPCSPTFRYLCVTVTKFTLKWQVAGTLTLLLMVQITKLAAVIFSTKGI